MTTCGTCKHFQRQNPLDLSSPGDCFAHPPAAHIMMSMGPLGQPAPQAVSVFPPRPAAAVACGEWMDRKWQNMPSCPGQGSSDTASKVIHLPATMTGLPPSTPEDIA